MTRIRSFLSFCSFRSPVFWLLLALVLRLGFAAKLGNSFYQIDEGSYVSNAVHLAQTGVLGSGGIPSVAPPLPIAFFSLFLHGSRDLFWPRAGGALLGVLVVWLIGRLARELSGSEKAGLIALAISSVYPFFIYYSAMLLSETSYLAALTAGLWRLCKSLGQGGRARSAAAGGLALGVAALSRPEAAPIAVLIWAATAVPALRGAWPRRFWGTAVLFWALPILLWCARNKLETGAFVLDVHGGISMLHGTLLFDANEQDTEIAMAQLRRMPFYKRTRALPEAQRDRACLARAFKFMRRHPAETLSQWGRKLVNFWRFYPRVDKKYALSAASNPSAGLSRSVLVLISLLFEPCLILGGFWGLWKMRAPPQKALPLWIFVLGTMLLHMVSVSQMRYRLPVMPALITGFSSLFV